MDPMRDILRTHLGQSLSAARPEDRLAAAWTVACGRAMANHGSVVSYDEGIVRIQVADPTWLQQMIDLRSTLARDLARISGLPVTSLHFELEKETQHKGLTVLLKGTALEPVLSEAEGCRRIASARGFSP